MWSEALAAGIPDYRSAVLSWVEPSGDPTSIRCRIVLRRDSHVIELTDLAPVARAWRGKACLLFHMHDERLEGLRQMVLKGMLGVAEDGSVEFAVSDFVTANGKPNTDQMPHASAPLHMFAFYRLGRSKARAYLAKRGAPWPPIPFEQIVRSVGRLQAADAGPAADAGQAASAAQAAAEQIADAEPAYSRRDPGSGPTATG
ncbi:MAG TPA: hypothetical protein VIB99_04505 [Candidatus Limnocylindrales bacterium]